MALLLGDANAGRRIIAESAPPRAPPAATSGGGGQRRAPEINPDADQNERAAFTSAVPVPSLAHVPTGLAGRGSLCSAPHCQSQRDRGREIEIANGRQACQLLTRHSRCGPLSELSSKAFLCRSQIVITQAAGLGMNTSANANTQSS